MANKRGRPIIPDSRNFGYRLRLNKEEKEQLCFISKTLEKPRSEVIRELLQKEYFKLSKV